MDKHFGSEAESTPLWHTPSQVSADTLSSILEEAENKEGWGWGVGAPR